MFLINKQALLKNAKYLFSLHLIFCYSCPVVYFLLTFHGSIFLNIKLEPTTTLSPRRRSHGLHNPHSSHDHDVQFSCAITQPLLAHHWRVHQCLLTSGFTALLIPWGASAPGGKMRKQLLKYHNFLNNSPIFIIESSYLIYLLFKKHCIQYISI